MSKNENTTTQNLWDTVKAVLRGRFIAIQVYHKKQEKSQIYNLTSLMAQRLKHLPTMLETWVQSLGSIPRSGRSPGEGNGNTFQYSCLENLMNGGAWWATVHGFTKSQTQLSDFALLCFAFLLLTLGFFISSFSSCFRCRVRLFISLFSCFLR